MLHGPPDNRFCDVVIFVAIDVSRPHDRAPKQIRVTIAEALGKAAGRFGDDLEATGCGAKRPTIRLRAFD